MRLRQGLRIVCEDYMVKTGSVEFVLIFEMVGSFCVSVRDFIVYFLSAWCT